MKKITDGLATIGQYITEYVKTMPLFDRGVYFGLVAGAILGHVL